MKVLNFASAALINKAKLIKSELSLPDQVVIPGAEDGLFKYEDNISIVNAQEWKGKVIGGKYSTPKLDPTDEDSLMKDFTEVVGKLNIDIPTTLSVYLEVIGNKVYLVRSINIKGL